MVACRRPFIATSCDLQVQPPRCAHFVVRRDRMNAARHSSNLADDPADDLSEEQHRSHRLRFELIFASLWLAFGLFVLPAIIYMVGTLLLGPYGENQGLGAFYADFFKDLVEPAGRAWILALGPLVVVSILRLVFLGKAPHEDSEREPRQTAEQAPAPRSRVEPRVSGD